jgi:hypothetical protein
MQNTKAIFESLLKRNLPDPENKTFLTELTAAHPYFSPVQFFLLQLTEENTEAFEKQAAKTNLLFNNPHWLNFQLQQSKQNFPSPELQTIEPAQNLPDDTDATGEPEMEKEIEPMHIELKMPEEKSTINEEMLFEPMHLVDYFASQGIKLTEEVQTADKLGKQLKSFTEWLKTMKKVHVETEELSTDQSDLIIQTLAEKSNTEGEVLTESMADVFIKQGKIAKASEVYLKLSLLNPAKSAYFAAKLENLKGL